MADNSWGGPGQLEMNTPPPQQSPASLCQIVEEASLTIPYGWVPDTLVPLQCGNLSGVYEPLSHSHKKE